MVRESLFIIDEMDLPEVGGDGCLALPGTLAGDVGLAVRQLTV